MPHRFYSVFDWYTGQYAYYVDPTDSYKLGEDVPALPTRTPTKSPIGESIEDFLATLPRAAKLVGHGTVLRGEGAVIRGGR